MSSLSPIGSPFIELPSVDSTNNYAMGLVHAGMAQHGTAVFTHEQTKGKGQRNRQWQSQKDQNIAISLVIEPKSLVISELFILSMTIATGVNHFFNSYTNGDVKIKWPNDIYWRDRKAGGILIENNITGAEWNFSIAGIGLNINQINFGELNLKAVSLRQITGKEEKPVLLAKELCKFINIQYEKLLTHPNAIREEYRANMYRLNELVKFKKGTRIFEAVIKDVTKNGQLVVRHSVEELFNVGDVEWII